MSELSSNSGAEFLAGLYQPPLQRFPDPAKKGHSHQWAKAAAWGEALKEWLLGYNNEKTRSGYLRAVAQLLS